VLSSLALFTLAYFLLSTTLRQNDHEAVESELRRYKSLHQASGFEALRADAERQRKANLFVRIAGPANETLFMHMPTGWDDFQWKQLERTPATRDEEWIFLAGQLEGQILEDPDTLEILSARLGDGRIVQVGRSTELRGDILEYFRNVFAVVTLAVLGLGLAGGAFWARRFLRPVKDLVRRLRSIQETGRMDERLPTRQTGDELDELTGQLNALLATIESLVNRMRGSLDDVAHDLRTPLTRLRGAAEIALRSNADAETSRQALADCLEQAEQTLIMLNAMMDVAEAEAGTMKLERESVDVAALVQTTLGLYEHVAEEEGVAIHTQVAEGLRVWADGKRLRQALANLLDNAIKYNRRGGSVHIEAERRGTDVALTVRDTGIGIAPEELPRIWDRLYRGDASRPHRGLGLGLSLVRAVAVAHKGTVEARSEPGQGSALEIRLPAGESR
jgi:signal transduction histidine kinase